MKILETKGLKKYFYQLEALKGVDLHVEEGELLGLIGPNGSGKTTLFDCVTGVFKPSAGKVFFKGKDITALKPDWSYKLGIGRTFQLAQLFPEMTVLENMLLAIQESQGTMLNRLFRIREDENRNKALSLLEFLKIDHVKDEFAKNLSYGQQKLLDMGMVLMSDPELIMLDEPLAGVNRSLAIEIVERIRELQQNYGCTFVIIEHDMKVVMDLCERIIVLDYGEKIAEGTPEEIQNNESVLSAYFGG
jgi:branched-chain amino acid transport system ATP-binding protein